MACRESVRTGEMGWSGKVLRAERVYRGLLFRITPRQKNTSLCLWKLSLLRGRARSCKILLTS